MQRTEAIQGEKFLDVIKKIEGMTSALRQWSDNKTYIKSWLNPAGVQRKNLERSQSSGFEIHLRQRSHPGN